MTFPDPQPVLHALRRTLVSALLVLPIAILAGSASALFLVLLERVTQTRFAHPGLLWFLPLAGAALVFAYERFGKNAAGGNNLILDSIHEPGGGVPRRMAPFILLGTLVTHLFGGSAGREGTAVQMGGSLASAYARLCRFGEKHMRVALMAGVAAGFGSVFGTPLTGAVFAMEVLFVGRMSYEALLPVLVAGIVGDLTCSAWGVHHALYHIAVAPEAGAHAAFDLSLAAKIIVAAVAFGLVARAFSELTHRIGDGLKRVTASGPLRAALGGLAVIALAEALGTRDFLGLGVSSPDTHAVTLLSCFHADGAQTWSWLWKLVFTAVTLGAGFKGGEVTPLFFIGAALGNTLAVLFGAPPDLFAGLGFIAVFAGASNTPLACTLMGMELFGAHYAAYFAVACFVAYRFSGHGGIYHAQRVAVPKFPGVEIPEGSTLGSLRRR